MARFFTYSEAFAGTAAAIKSFCEGKELRRAIHFFCRMSKGMPDDCVAKRQYRELSYHRDSLLSFESYIVSLSGMRSAVREAIDCEFFTDTEKDTLRRILADSEGFSEKIGTYGPAEKRYCLA